MILNKYEAGESALAYIQTQLKNGNTYAHYILESNLLQAGNVETYIPSSLFQVKDEFGDSLLKAYSDHGGEETELHRELQTLSANLISHYLTTRNQYVILERLGRSDSPSIQRENKHYFTYSKDVYLILTNKYTDFETIQDYWNDARGYPRIVGLTSLPEHRGIYNGQSVEEDLFILLAKRTDYLIIGAYDDEGYLVWTRRENLL